MAAKVFILEKSDSIWSQMEITALNRVGVEVEAMGSRPGRIVAMNKPLQGTFQQALGHLNFTAKEADYRDRWA